MKYPPFPLIFVLVFFLIASVSIREVGLVGEVAAGWALDSAPHVLVQDTPELWADGAAATTAGHQIGPLVASQARPIERLSFPMGSMPLAINMYTSGISDWGSRLVWVMTDSLKWVMWWHLALGGILILLVYRFLHFHGSRVSATVAALVLSTDWAFLFYRKVLGGTEILLQAAALLCLWSLWSRRWRGGRHGLTGFAVGVAVGISAKLTFGLTLIALLLAALLTRWDKPQLRPPLPGKLWRPALVFAVIVCPLVWTWVHHLVWVPGLPHIQSHDFFGVQFDRVMRGGLGGSVPVRESIENLFWWVRDPLMFFGAAYGAQTSTASAVLPVLAWLVSILGVGVAWSDRHPTPRLALLRFCSVFLVLQTLILWWVARDLHHLASTSVTLSIVVGLSVGTLVKRFSPSHSMRHYALSMVLALPWAMMGLDRSLRTDAVIATIPVPTFTKKGQSELISMLREHGVERVVACDYELTGVLEVLAPDIHVVHGWGAASQRRSDVLPSLIRRASGGHFLVLDASAPMIYNQTPSEGQMMALALELGLVARKVATLGSATALYEVSEKQSAVREVHPKR